VTLFIGRLSFKATDDDLLAAFEPFGTVTSARIARERDTGRSRGFGFVEMPDEARARKAMEAMNDQPICGRPVKVSEARTRE
jgi:RNA recognition motif-containing protein